MYTVPKQLRCVYHYYLSQLSETAFAKSLIPDCYDVAVFQARGEAFYFSDSPMLPGNLTTDGIMVPDGSTYVYSGDFSDFYYKGTAVVYFYASR